MADNPSNGSAKTTKDGKGDGKTTSRSTHAASQTSATRHLTQSVTISQASQTVSNATSSPTVGNQSNSSSDSATITGGVVGGIFALVGVVLLLWFARQGRKKIPYRRTNQPTRLPSFSPETALYHHPPSLQPSMQSIRVMHPVAESPFEEEHGQRPLPQFPDH